MHRIVSRNWGAQVFQPSCILDCPADPDIQSKCQKTIQQFIYNHIIQDFKFDFNFNIDSNINSLNGHPRDSKEQIDEKNYNLNGILIFF